MQKENSHINWTQDIFIVKQNSDWVQLSLQKSKMEPKARSINMISAKQMSRMLRKRQVNRVFIGLIRMVATTKEGSDNAHTEDPKDKWRQDLPIEIKEVLEEYNDIFLNDLPSRLPPA